MRISLISISLLVAFVIAALPWRSIVKYERNGKEIPAPLYFLTAFFPVVVGYAEHRILLAYFFDNPFHAGSLAAIIPIIAAMLLVAGEPFPRNTAKPPKAVDPKMETLAGEDYQQTC